MLSMAEIEAKCYYEDGMLKRKFAYRKYRVGDRLGWLRKDGYYAVWLDNRNQSEHRVIFFMHHGYLPEYVDHIDGNSQNNHIENLREATNMQNMQNARMPVTNTSGVKGVSWCKRDNKWYACLSVNSKTVRLGTFTSIQEATACIVAARIKYHGAFANHG